MCDDEKNGEEFFIETPLSPFDPDPLPPSPLGRWPFRLSSSGGGGERGIGDRPQTYLATGVKSKEKRNVFFPGKASR